MTDRLQLQVVLDAVERITGPLRSITATSSETGTEIKELREKLRGLQEQQQTVASFRALKEKLGNDAQALEEARRRTSALGGELAVQQQRLQPLQSAYTASTQRTEAMASAQAALKQRLNETRAAQTAAAKGATDALARSRSLQERLNQKGLAPGMQNHLAKELSVALEARKSLVAQEKAHAASLRGLRTEHRAGAAALKVARAETRGHESDLKAAQAAVDHVQKEMSAATKVASRLKAVHAAGGQELQRLRARLADAGIKTSELSRHERELRGSVTQANAALEQQKRKLAEVAKQQAQMAAARDRLAKTQQLAGSAAAAGAGAAGVAYATSRPLGAITRAFMPAEDASMQLRASMMGADGKVSAEFQQIDALAKRLGDRLPGTTADFIEMMTMLRRQGLSAQSILGGTGEAAAYLGVQLKMPATDAAEFAAKMQDSTRTAEKDMMGLMDTIQRTYYLGVDPQNMLAGFNKLSPAMRLIKKEGVAGANALAPLLVMMDQTGMAGESAGNALRKVFQSGVDMKKFGDANDLLKDFKAGFQLDFTDGKGNFGSIDNLFAQLGKLKQLNDVQRGAVMKEMFGDDAETIQVVETLIAKGVAGYQEVAAKMQAQADLRTRVNEQLTTLTNVTEAAQGSFTNALSEIGAAVAPQLKTMIQWLGERANAFGAWVRENPKLAATMFWVAASIAAVAAVVAGLALTVAAVLGPMAIMRFALTTLGIKGGVLGMVLGSIGRGARQAAGPLRQLGGLGSKLLALRGPLAAMWAVAAPAQALGGLRQMPDRITKAVAAVRNKVGGVKSKAGDAVRNIVTRVKVTGAAGLDLAAGLLRRLGTAFRLAASGAMAYLRTHGLLGTALNLFRGGITGVLGLLRGGASGIMTAAAAGLRLVGQALLFAGRAALLNPIGLAITGIALAAGLIIKFWGPIKAWFSGFWAGLTAGFAPVKDSLAGLATALSPLKPLWDGISSGISSVLSWLGQLLAPFQATEQQLDGATGAGRSFGQWLGGFLAMIISLPAKFITLGAGIVSGLISGIAGAAKGLWDAVAGLAAGVKDRFKVQLGIKSPSRVFAALGDDTMAGLRVGLERSGGGPLAAVQQVARQVTQAGAAAVAPGVAAGVAPLRAPVERARQVSQRMLPAVGLAAAAMTLPVAAQQPVIDRRPPLAAVAGAPARAAQQITVEGDTIHLTVQAAPGTDMRQMQQMIERVLDERDRRKAARLRTALADRE